MERKSYVYKITCLVTGEYYFGSSFNAKSDKYWGKGRKIKERISQYGKENFVKDILGEFDDRVDAHKIENEYIEKFRNDEKCLNIHLDHHFGTYGEESRAKIGVANAISLRGKHRTDEFRAKMSAVKLGKHLSEEHRAKIGAGNRGKHRTDKFRAKISAAFRGKHRTEETKQKIRESMIGRTPGNKGKKLNKETGKYE